MNLMNRVRQNKKYLDWAIGLWMGIALMSLINIWKIVNGYNAVSYDWIMFGISVIFLIVMYLLKRKEK